MDVEKCQSGKTFFTIEAPRNDLILHFLDPNKEKIFNLIKEIKTILTYTNATPYKTKNVRYYCAYCSDGPHFEDPDELRTHTRTQHVSDRTERVEFFMRPYCTNEVVKLDIENLICTVCCTAISNWNEMFKHLKEAHNVILDLAYKRVIPYTLTLNLNLECALCKESFSNYMHLEGHMNAHYDNYVCEDCGETFLTRNRLKQHAKIHEVRKFPCSLCPKVFSLEKNRRKHERLIHKNLTQFKCWYCPEKFTREYARHLHCLQKHKEKVKTITCELCGATFTWRNYYTCHMKKKHSNAKRYECDVCFKKLSTSAALKEHILKHAEKNKKIFECPACNKKYASLATLKQHLKSHLQAMT